jgi:hypothetical protein
MGLMAILAIMDLIREIGGLYGDLIGGIICGIIGNVLPGGLLP